jgi:hypothetical protein
MLSPPMSAFKWEKHPHFEEINDGAPKIYTPKIVINDNTFDDKL